MSNYRIITAFLKKYPLFLIVLLMFFIYNGYNQLFGFLPFAVVFFNFLCILCGVVLFYFLFRFLLKTAEKAAIFTFLLTVLMLSFGYIHDSMKNYLPGSFIIKYKFLLPILIMLVSILYFCSYYC
jgi:hypothetical protein